jgi:hypothetical protein
VDEYPNSNLAVYKAVFYTVFSGVEMEDSPLTNVTRVLKPGEW